MHHTQVNDDVTVVMDNRATGYVPLHQRMRFNHAKDDDALGLVFGQFEGEEMIWYAGGDIGFNSYVMRFPKQQLTIVCFSNFNSAGEAEKVAHQVGRILIQNKVLSVSKHRRK